MKQRKFKRIRQERAGHCWFMRMLRNRQSKRVEFIAVGWRYFKEWV